MDFKVKLQAEGPRSTPHQQSMRSHHVPGVLANGAMLELVASIVGQMMYVVMEKRARQQAQQQVIVVEDSRCIGLGIGE